jgi:hypothetical protein
VSRLRTSLTYLGMQAGASVTQTASPLAAIDVMQLPS